MMLLALADSFNWGCCVLCYEYKP